jgi:Zn-dependent protease/predicted transcriptional regulator
MRPWRLARLWGIAIQIDPSWLFIFGLLTWQLATLQPAQRPLWYTWGVAVSTSLLLFASVLLHELAHSYTAVRLGIPVQSVTLFLFGGVARITKEPDRPGVEFLVAIVGPLTSFLLGAGFGLMWVLGGIFRWPFSEELSFLALNNLLLAGFNLLPGFPLDGGRLLRAVLWFLGGNVLSATRIATLVGQGLAVLFVVGGLVQGFRYQSLSWFWLAIIGLFLGTAATASYRQLRIRETLRGVPVAALMHQNYQLLPSSLALSQAAPYLQVAPDKALPVVDFGRLVGLLSLSAVQRLSTTAWSVTTVGQVMTPAARLTAVTPQSAASQLSFGEREDTPVLVVDEGRLVGLVGPSAVRQFIKARGLG